MQQRLKSLSTELVTLRNRLHVGQTTSDVTGIDGPAAAAAAAVANLVTSATNHLSSNGPFQATNTTNMQTLPTNGSSVKPITNSNNNKINLKVCAMPFISSRNTSIPHPLPHHITGKMHGKILYIFICNKIYL